MEVKNAGKGWSRQSPSCNAQEVRKEEGGVGLLGDSKQKGERKNQGRSRQERLQEKAQEYPWPPSEEALKFFYYEEICGMGEIGKLYGKSGTAVSKLLKQHNIKSRPKRSIEKIKFIKGEEHKLCKGVHHRGGFWVPTKMFPAYDRYGIYLNYCLRCRAGRQGSVPLVPLTPAVRTMVEECVRRLGITETARRANVSTDVIRRIRSMRKRGTRRGGVKQDVFKRLYAVRQQLRESGEIRHRDSIHHGSLARGRKEKIPTQRPHFYVVNGDSDTNARKAYRARTGR